MYKFLFVFLLIIVSCRSTKNSPEPVAFMGGLIFKNLVIKPAVFNIKPTSKAKHLPLKFTLLTYNIGNPDTEHSNYALRLDLKSYEKHISKAVLKLNPDIVLLQEVLSEVTCASFKESNPERLCYNYKNEKSAIQRILGKNYTIVCDSRKQVECIGIKITFGKIKGLKPGEFQYRGAVTPSLPMPGCNWSNGECTNEMCDDESTVSAVTVQTVAGDIKVVNMHPMASPGEGSSGDPCRTLQIRQVFEDNIVPGEQALVHPEETAIIAGDWNLGLELYWFRTFGEESQAQNIWYQYINNEKSLYVDHDPRDNNGKRYSTYIKPSTTGRPNALDHVVTTRNINGNCIVHGGTPETFELDYDFPDLENIPDNRRIDHRAISCNFILNSVQK